MTRSIDHVLLALLGRSNWVSTRKQLLAGGISSSAIDRRLASGLLRSFGNGVIGLAAAPDRQRQIARACLLAHPSGALSHIAAAYLHELPMGQIPWSPHLVVPHGRPRSLSSPAVVHQSRRLPASDLTVVDDLRTTTVARTLVDLSQIVTTSRSLFLAEWAIKEGKCSASELRACVEPLLRSGAPGAAARRLVLEQIADQPVDLSALEHEFLLLVIANEIPGLIPQYQPPWYDGIRGIVDFADPVKRKIVEIDGRRWHTLTQDTARDRARERTARREGWGLARYGFAEIRHRPLDVIADLRVFLELDRSG